MYNVLARLFLEVSDLHRLALLLGITVKFSGVAGFGSPGGVQVPPSPLLPSPPLPSLARGSGPPDPPPLASYAAG